jgi:alginate O-acetyltransferase complex protein AlgI
MVFSSNFFLLMFLPAFLLAYYLTPLRHRNKTALLGSAFFYAWGAPLFIFVLFASATADHLIGQWMEKINDAKQKKLWLALALVINVGVLAYFKYANFFVDNVNQILMNAGVGRLKWTAVVLPIGISFFTFQKISYLVDVYRGETKAFKNIFNYYLFVVLFPQLIAGPIVRYKEIADQIRDRVSTENMDNRLQGFFRFCVGLAKKVFIANVMGQQADIIFSLGGENLNSPVAWLGLLAYSFQIYFDFSGYSDMAIGLGRMMGFTFPENFNFPYIARSITEFWRRWHITLSNWMKDYLYIPLGGNQGGSGRTYLNLWVVFLISGLWHGASWNFVIWGAYHGLFLVLERLFLGRFLKKIGGFAATLFTFVVAILGWVWFRAETLADAITYFAALFSFEGSTLTIPSPGPKFMLMLALAFLFSFIGTTKFSHKMVDFYARAEATNSLALVRFVLSVVLLFLCVGEIGATGFNPFIYFRF